MATIGIAQLLGFLILLFADLLPDVPPGGDFPTLVPKDWSWQVSPELLIGARDQRADRGADPRGRCSRGS